MILTSVAHSYSTNHISNDIAKFGGYFYCANWNAQVAIYDLNMNWVAYSPYSSKESHYWDNNYFVQSDGVVGSSCILRFSHFNGAIVSQIYSITRGNSSNMCTLNGSYVLGYDSGYIRFYNYTGTVISSTSFGLRALWGYMMPSGDRLWTKSETTSGFGCYIDAWSVSGSTLTWLAQYVIDDHTAGYSNKVGFPYLPLVDEDMPIGIENRIDLIHWNGSSFNKIAEFPCSIPGDFNISFMSKYKDYLVGKSCSPDMGSRYNLIFFNKYNFIPLYIFPRSTNFDVGSYVDGDYIYISADSLSGYAITKYSIVDDTNNGKFNASWM